MQDINHLNKKISEHQHGELYFSLLDEETSFTLSKINLKKIIFVTSDNSNIELLSEQLKFFAPKREIITIPSWDILPYDRISPNSTLSTKRIEGICRASQVKDAIIITNIQSFIQKTIPRNILINACKKISIGDSFSRDNFIKFLLSNGYTRADIASEAGDFAVRGSIIDIVPIDAESGYRIDFICNEIDAIRTYDLASQISISNQISDIFLYPASEIIYSDKHKNIFLDNYIKLFGNQAKSSILYQSILENRKYPGVEHWLPLFYEEMSHISDLIDCPIIFDDSSEDLIQDFLKKAKEYYQARFDELKIYKDSNPYYPIAIEYMWQNICDIQQLKEQNLVIKFDRNVLKNNRSINFLHESRLYSKSAFDLLKEKISKDCLKQDHKAYIIAAYNHISKERLKTIFDSHQILYKEINSVLDIMIKNTVYLTIIPFTYGVVFEEFVIISEQDLLGEKFSYKRKTNRKIENFLSDISCLQTGELVVHYNHGIGMFIGIETLQILGQPHDCIKLDYANSDKLYIPVENLDMLSRYGSNDAVLDKLGSTSWQQRKAILKNKIKDIAKNLMKVAAERAVQTAHVFNIKSELYEEFCAKFPYAETDDQLNAIQDIEHDLSQNKPMDRLVCGDVGFGKTEIALRAAFLVCKEEGHQVAVIVPTTLLARQHYINFKERFENFGIRIKQLSRLVNQKESSIIRQDLAEGKLDIIIGTHSLLSKSIKFYNLSLLIIDEEQHFGVTQKETLKQIKNNIHVLTLSATPIPRTLQMSLSGIKDLSLIATPPIDRLSVRTYVMSFDKVVVKEAILREYYRGGKIFFVCPFIKDLDDLYDILHKLVPEVKIVIAHGKMSPTKLDDLMNDFYNGKYDILLSTTIVESGLDIPSANTMFIYKADQFGLSALYQLRGRVGRGKIRAYTYLLLPEGRTTINPLSAKRLEIMQTIDSLGSGFNIASHDMDIRGFGNLVGDEQSGHIKEIGVELYQTMLKEAVDELHNNEEKINWSPQINIDLPIMIPISYVEDLSVRMGLYKNISMLSSENDIENFSIELLDRFGVPPLEVEYLLTTIRLKILCKKINIEKLDIGPKAIVIKFIENKCIFVEKLLNYIMQHPTILKIRSDHRLVFTRENIDINNRIDYCYNCLKLLIKIGEI